jgi:hypothetical protein
MRDDRGFHTGSDRCLLGSVDMITQKKVVVLRPAGVDPRLAATSGPWHRYEHALGASKPGISLPRARNEMAQRGPSRGDP